MPTTLLQEAEAEGLLWSQIQLEYNSSRTSGLHSETLLFSNWVCVWNVLLTLSSYIQFISFFFFKRLLSSKLTNSTETLWLPMYGHDCLGDYKEKKTVIPAKRWQPTICDVGIGASDGIGVTCTSCSMELRDRACVQCVMDTEGTRLSAVTCVHFKYVQFILNYTSRSCKQLGNFWKVTTTNYGNTESTSVCCFK